MTDTQLQTQFARCLLWQDADQWDALAHAYFAAGYPLNAAACFQRADELRGCAFAESGDRSKYLGEYAGYVEM